jgi:uracil-DNA glycosylase
VPRRPAPTIAHDVTEPSSSAGTGREAVGVRSSSRNLRYRLVQTQHSRRPSGYLDHVASAETRREELKAVWQQAQACTKCPQLAATRTTVVFGAGNADADLMFVGEAPGANEDKQGLPFVGQAGRLLETLLGEIGLARADVFIANTLLCRPPGNRDPLPGEIDSCQDWLFRKLELIEPRVICTLGNFSTKLLRADPATGITRLHGREEIRTIGPRTVRLYPLYHPAAALYTPSMLEILRADFRRIPELLALPALPQPAPADAELVVPEPALVADASEAPEPEPAQLGLF